MLFSLRSLVGASGPFGEPADLLLQPLHPLMAAVCEVCPLGYALLVVCAGWLDAPRLSKGVMKVLADEAHHEALAGSELPCSHRWPGAWRGSVDDAHPRLAGNYVLLVVLSAVSLVLGRMES